MDGKERQKLVRQRLHTLFHGNNKPMKGQRRPREIAIGIADKQRKQATKRQEEARQMGLITKGTKHLYELPQTKTRQLAIKEKEKERVQLGYAGGAGKYRGGALHFSKKEIAGITADSNLKRVQALAAGDRKEKTKETQLQRKAKKEKGKKR